MKNRSFKFSKNQIKVHIINFTKKLRIGINNCTPRVKGFSTFCPNRKFLTKISGCEKEFLQSFTKTHFNSNLIFEKKSYVLLFNLRNPPQNVYSGHSTNFFKSISLNGPSGVFFGMVGGSVVFFKDTFPLLSSTKDRSSSPSKNLIS